jgi:type IV pilus assembly protein PilE
MRKPTPTSLISTRKAAGVTLIELAVVVVIIGVLAAIGVPAYRNYMQRTHRTEAKSALLRIAVEQERFYLQNNTYTNNLALLGFPAGVTENSVYTLTIPAANALAFQIQAAPTVGGGTNGVDQTADVECATFTIDSQGIRTAAPNPNNRCW